MAKIEMINMSSSTMDEAIAKQAGPLRVLTAPKGWAFKVEVEVDDKIAKEVGKDPLLNSKMKDAVKAVYDDLVEFVGGSLKNCEVGAVKLVRSNDLEMLTSVKDTLNNGNEGARKAALAKAEKDCLAVWDELAKTKKEYGKYKIKIVAKITAAFAGLVTSITLFATGTVSFGATAIPAVVGMAKSVAVIGKELVSAYQEIETAQKRLDEGLTAIETKFKNAKGELSKRGMAQEAGTALASQFFGTDGPFAVLPSIKGCVGDLGTVKSKFAGITLKSHDAAKSLDKILKTVEAEKKAFLQAAEKKLQKHPLKDEAQAQVGKIKEQMDKAMADSVGKVTDAIHKVIAAVNRVKTAEPKVKVAEVRLAELVKLKGKGWKIFENVLVLSDVALSFTDPSNVGETLIGLDQALGSLAADKLTKVVCEGTFLE